MGVLSPEAVGEEGEGADEEVQAEQQAQHLLTAIRKPASRSHWLLQNCC